MLWLVVFVVVVLVLTAAVLVVAWVVLRIWGSRKSDRAFPVWLAWIFDNRIAESYSGLQIILDRAGIASGMRVVDAGCGPGRLTIPIARRVAPSGEVVALDRQQGMLARLRKRADRVGVRNLTTVQVSLDDYSRMLEIGRHRFDRALLVTVLGEVPNRKRLMAGLFQALKPGGVLSVTELLVDPDYVPRNLVTLLAQEAGFLQDAAFGNFLMFTVNFKRPT